MIRHLLIPEESDQDPAFGDEDEPSQYNSHDHETIAKFGDSEIDNVCRTLRRDSSLPIPELAVTRLKLLAFWVRHQHRTGRVIGGVHNPLVRTDLATLNQLKEQKRLEDGWAANNKEPEYVPIALDLASAAKAFEKVKTLLTRIRGVLGVPSST